MNDLEEQLRNRFGAVADGEAVVVDTHGVVRLSRAERTRRRRVGVVAGAVVAVAVTAVGAAVVRPGTATTPVATSRPPVSVSDLPVGGPSDVPWWSDGAVRNGSGTLEVAQTSRPSLLQYRAGTIVVLDDDGGRILRGGVDVDLPALVSDVEISTDGRSVAWVETLEPRADPARVRVVLYDVEGRRVVGSFDRTVASPGPGGEDLGIAMFIDGVLDDGRVLLVTSGTGPSEVWAPGSAPVELDPPAGLSLNAFAPSSDRVVLGDGRDRAFLGDLRPDGTVVVGPEIGAGAGAWSPDGRSWVSRSFDVVTVETPAQGGGRTRLPLPTGETWDPFAWDSPTEVLLRSDPMDSGDPMEPRTTVVARCDVVTLACERVDGVPTTPVVLPRPAGY